MTLVLQLAPNSFSCAKKISAIDLVLPINKLTDPAPASAWNLLGCGRKSDTAGRVGNVDCDWLDSTRRAGWSSDLAGPLGCAASGMRFMRAAPNPPIEQPTKFKLVINIATAKVLGIAVAETVIALVDDVIE